MARLHPWIACAMIAAVLVCAANVSAQNRRPLNVLFIASDDLNSHLGCCGDAMVKTPNIDRLARMGVRFDHAYCQYPVCNGSRTSVFSGRYPISTGVFTNGVHPRSKLPDAVMLPEYFSKYGYFTARSGKMSHGRHEDAVHWDISESVIGGDEDDAQDAPRGKKAGKKARSAKAKNASAVKRGTLPGALDVPFGWSANDNPDEAEPDGRTARRVAQWLEEHRDQPFFIGAGFHKPHVPHAAPRPYFDLYPTDRIHLADEPPGHTDLIPRIAYAPKYFPDLSELQQKQIIQHYAACITFMDAQVGVLLEAMDRLKLWDNTIVVFWSDHGWHWGEHGGMWAKVSLMRESARVPLIVVAPGGKAGVTSSRVVELVSLYPTLAELAGLPKPPGVEGRSIAPLITEPNRPWDQVAITTVLRGRELGFSVRDQQFTYIEWPDGSKQLYDHDSDPLEYRNLAGESNYADTVRRLSDIIADHKRTRS